MGWEDDASKNYQDDAWDTFKWAWEHMVDYVKYSTWEYNRRWKELAWEGIRAWTKRFIAKIFSKAKDAYEDAKDYADWLIENLPDIAENVWGSITSLWAQFGAELLDTGETVWSWVTGKVNHVYWWIVSTYDDARIWVATQGDWVVEKADEFATWLENWAEGIVDWIENKAANVWTWIRDKADNVWTWITETGATIKAWYDRNATYYSDLYDLYRNQLLAFLEDPETFILDYVVDGIEYVVSWAVTLFW